MHFNPPLGVDTFDTFSILTPARGFFYIYYVNFTSNFIAAK